MTTIKDLEVGQVFYTANPVDIYEHSPKDSDETYDVSAFLARNIIEKCRVTNIEVDLIGDVYWMSADCIELDSGESHYGRTCHNMHEEVFLTQKEAIVDYTNLLDQEAEDIRSLKDLICKELL